MKASEDELRALYQHFQASLAEHRAESGHREETPRCVECLNFHTAIRAIAEKLPKGEHLDGADSDVAERLEKAEQGSLF